MKYCLFDIETGPLPPEKIEHLCPEFKAPANYKDPEKIAASIEEQKNAWMERGALSALTGQVLAIGIRSNGETRILHEGGEYQVLKDFWRLVEDCSNQFVTMVGYNINRFDIPFLIRRSWALHVSVPKHLLFGGRGYMTALFLDLAQEWQCGDRQEWLKLDTLCKFLGLEGKNGSGKDFAKLWETDRLKAIEYLQNDMIITARVMERLLDCSEIHEKEQIITSMDAVYTPERILY
jgi:predicted PolB exonuclease-like 3'-5' exonuclease